MNALSRTAMLALGALVALVLGWRIIVSALSAMDERGFAVAQKSARLPLGSPGAERPWRERLARNPADSKALVVLALELESTGKRAESVEAMAEALRLAPGDLQTLMQGVGFFLRNGDDSRALATLQRAVEAFPGEIDNKVWGVFTLAIDSGRYRSFFEQVARENPPWWQPFFRVACESAAIGAVQALFDVRAKANLALPEERRCLIDRLQREGQWTNAYVLWLNSLPLEQRNRVAYVFNGTFELPLSNVGFDWRIPPQDGIDVTTEATDGTVGKRALKVAFSNKRYSAPPIYQLLALSPGRYLFEGRSRSDLESWLGLQWGVYCAERNGQSGRQLVRTDRFVGAVDWTDFRQSLVVPGDCPAQVLRLELANPKRDATSPGNVVVRLKGRVWFDDMRITLLD